MKRVEKVGKTTGEMKKYSWGYSRLENVIIGLRWKERNVAEGRMGNLTRKRKIMVVTNRASGPHRSLGLMQAGHE